MPFQKLQSAAQRTLYRRLEITLPVITTGKQVGWCREECGALLLTPIGWLSDPTGGCPWSFLHLWPLTLSDNLICYSVGIIATSIFEITLIRRACAR